LRDQLAKSLNDAAKPWKLREIIADVGPSLPVNVDGDEELSVASKIVHPSLLFIFAAIVVSMLLFKA
jgi:hypothetical protein